MLPTMTPKRKQNREDRPRKKRAAKKKSQRDKLIVFPWPRHFMFREKLRLQGALTGPGPRVLTINSHTHIHLTLRMFMVLLVLFAHGKKVAGKATKFQVFGLPFLSAEQ